MRSTILSLAGSLVRASASRLCAVREWALAALAAVVLHTVAPAQVVPAPDLVLHGSIRPDQRQSYVQAPFKVPAGTHRITVAFHNLGKAQHTVIDLGLLDPAGFRGASGGNKQEFTVSDTDATPSYLPGAMPSGVWNLLLAVPNIRPGVTSQWTADVWFNRQLEDTSFMPQPLRQQEGWYRGDLHMHDAHSDGSCPSQSGKSVPCPLFFTVNSAARRGLDFIAITEHNTTAQNNDERELQPFFDKLLLVPGRELTTFFGHANAYGTTRFIDYRVGTPAVPDANTMFQGARTLGAIVSINHPESPTGEVCMGCGWTPAKPVDMHLVSSVEVVNGSGRPATRFWEEQLRQGFRLTAIGGSDNHRGTQPLAETGSIGYPTTVIYARNLSVAALLDGIRSGHVFIDAQGSRDRVLDIQATAGAATATMGGNLRTESETDIAMTVHVAGCQGATVNFFVDGSPSATLPSVRVATADQTAAVKWHAASGRHWVRAEVRDAHNQLLLLGNPVYVNFDDTPHR